MRLGERDGERIDVLLYFIYKVNTLLFMRYTTILLKIYKNTYNLTVLKKIALNCESLKSSYNLWGH
jgi:hypothetical protein